MAYAPIAYTTSTEVERILRTSNNKIIVGNNPGELSTADLDGYILDASKFIDAFLRQVVLFDNLPVATYTEKPEIGFAAPRLTAYLIHRDMYSSYRTDQLGAGVNGWLKETNEFVELLMKNINNGVYTDLSPATGGIQYVTAEQFFQTQIGVRGIRTPVEDRENQVPTKLGNIGPYEDGTLG